MTALRSKRPLMWQAVDGQTAEHRPMEQRRSSQSFKRKELVGKLNPAGVRAAPSRPRPTAAKAARAILTSNSSTSSSNWCSERL